MRYKTMKKSGEKISAITVGTWAIGGKNSMGGGYGEIDDQDSIEAIKAMIDGGVNLIDTAPIYGEGHSEEVVGKAIEGIRDKVLIATKYGSYIEDGKGVHCSRPDSVLREFDASLKRLNTDYVDMYLMHWPDDLGTPIEDTMACVNKLKEQGAVRMLGLCNSDRALIERASAVARYRHRAASVLHGQPVCPLRPQVVRGERHRCHDVGFFGCRHPYRRRAREAELR